MEYRILKKQLRNLAEEAKKAAKNNGLEICGFLVDNGYFVELIQTKNKSKILGQYSFYKGEVAAIEKSCSTLEHQIIGTFHSHPFSSAEPSASDVRNAFDEEIMLIVSVCDDVVKLWDIGKGNKNELTYQMIE